MAEGVVSLRLPEADMAALRLAAAERKATISDVVRDALRMYLGQDSAVRVMPLIDAAVAKHADRLAAMVARTFIASDMAWRLGRLTLLATATVERKAPLEPVEFVEEVCRASERLAAVDLRGKGLKIIQPDDVYESALARAGGDASGE